MDRQTLVSVGETCMCLALRSAARSIARRYDEALRPLALSNGQFAMLVAVRAMQPASIQALGERLGMDRTTVTAALKPLQRRALLVVDVAKRDLRGRSVSLTPEGGEVLAAALPLWKEVQREIAELLGGEERAAAIRNQLSAVA